MSMPGQQSHYNEHQIRQASATATSSLSVPTIIEIAVCGGVGLLGVLLSTLYFVARSKHRKEKLRQSWEELDEDQEIRRAIRSTCPPDLDLGRRKYFFPFFGNKKISVSNQWIDEAGLHGPHMEFGPDNETGGLQKGYPLVSLQPPVLPHPPPEEPFSPSDLYPVISPPRPPAIPHPSFSRGRSYDPALGHENLSVAGIPWSTVRYVPYEPQKLAIKRRSVSDNQLTSILRSTSQRMRERRASQRPLSRAQSVLSQISGVPPSQRLPSPRRKKFGGSDYGDSREVLIEARDESRRASEQSYETSNWEAILDNFPTRRTPSPSKHFPWSADHVTGKVVTSSSAASDEDSLCNGKTPDLVIPFYLTSPSKRNRDNLGDSNGNDRHPVRIYSEDEEGEENAKQAMDISTKIRKDSRASIQAIEYFDLAAQHRCSLTECKESKNENNPFYSVLSNDGKPTARVNQILIGRRSPQVKSYMPKRGHSRKVSTMSKSFLSQSPTFSETKLPLGDISGNRVPTFSGQDENCHKLSTQFSNFQWSPEPVRFVGRKVSVTNGPGITKRQHQGHKRQNVVRMFGLPRPRSVCPVPEELEDFNHEDVFLASGLDLSKVSSAPPLSRLHSSESLARSTPCASMYSRYSMTYNIPPSSSVFEPRLTFLPPNGKTIHQSMSITSLGSSPTLGPYHPNLSSAFQNGYDTACSSPSIARCNSQTLEADVSTDEFPGPHSTLNTFSKTKAGRIMGRNFSIDCGPAVVNASINCDRISTVNTFSLPSATPSPSPLPAIYSQPVPPLLTRLRSPNSPQRIPNSSDLPLKNITQLRRGDSVVSSYSLNSMSSNGLATTDEAGHSVTDFRGKGRSPGKRGCNSRLNLSNSHSISSSPTRRGREFRLSSRSGTISLFKSVTFEESHESSNFGLGLGFSSSDKRHSYATNEHKVFENIEQEPDSSTTTPSKKLKSIRKATKSSPKLGSDVSTSDLASTATATKSTNELLIEKSKERSFEFENYSFRHFENSIRFITEEDDDDDDDDEDITTPGEVEIREYQSLATEIKASTKPQFHFQGQNNTSAIGQGSGWDMYSNSRGTLAPSPSMGVSISHSISPMQLSYTATSIPSHYQSNNTQERTNPITNTPLSPNSQHQNNKGMENLSPSPTSSCLSQILQNKHQAHDIIQVHYPKTLRWVWEETTPQVSSSPSPDRTSPNRMYKAHSRKQSQSKGIPQERPGEFERRMGNPLSSNPTVSTLMMERELGMEEPRIIDLDEVNNFPLPAIGPLPYSSADREGECNAGIGEQDIAEVYATADVPIDENGSGAGKGKSSRKRRKSSVENLFSRSGKGEGGMVKRGSLYDQDGFLKSSPA